MRLLPTAVVAAGGAAGALARWAATGAFGAASDSASLAWALLTVNTAGSFVLGAVIFASPGGTRELLRLGLGVGFCGGLTTFSSFATLTVELSREGTPAGAAAFAAVSVIAAVAAVAAGAALARVAARPPKPQSRPC